MTGADQIIAHRRKGMRPAWVTLMLDCGKARTVGDVTISEADTRPDFRFLVGLDVVLTVPSWSERVARMWEAVKAANPAYAILAVLAWDDVGLMWKPGYEDRPFGEGW